MYVCATGIWWVGPGTLLHNLQCTAQQPQIPASAEAEKPCSIMPCPRPHPPPAGLPAPSFWAVTYLVTTMTPNHSELTCFAQRVKTSPGLSFLYCKCDHYSLPCSPPPGAAGSDQAQMPAASLPHRGGAEETGSQILRDLASSSNPTLLAPPHSPSLDESTLLLNSRGPPFLLSTPRARNVHQPPPSCRL